MRNHVTRPIMPHEALAFALALSPRLGRASLVQTLPIDTIRHILKDLLLAHVTIMTRPYRACVQPVWRVAGEQFAGQQIMKMRYLPSLLWLGRVLALDVAGSSSCFRYLAAWRGSNKGCEGRLHPVTIIG